MPHHHSFLGLRQENTRPWLDFSVLDFLLILSDLSLTREIDTKKAESFAKLHLLNDRTDQNTNFAKLPGAKYIFYHNWQFYHSIQELKFLKNDASFLCKFEGTREKHFHKNQALQLQSGMTNLKLNCNVL